MQILDGNITEEEILGKLRRWPERTTTSPSGLHLGHYHAMWRSTGIAETTEDPKEQVILKAQKLLRKAHTKLLQYISGKCYAGKGSWKPENTLSASAAYL